MRSGAKGKKMTLSLDGRSDRLIMDMGRQDVFGTIITTIHPFLPPGMEKEMATHSGILAWRIPWAEKPGRLQSKGSQRVGHD